MQKLMLIYSLKCKNLEKFRFFSGDIFWLKTTTGYLEKQVLNEKIALCYGSHMIGRGGEKKPKNF